MWRPTMRLLCLIAALAGTPLRQAEAAGDLARSLAELDGGGVVEEIDGGVGDDAGEAIVRASDGPCSSQETNAPTPDDWPRITPAAVGSLSPRHPTGPGDRPTSRTSVDSSRRHAWLHRFLF
jgi:hypothetical protein